MNEQLKQIINKAKIAGSKYRLNTAFNFSFSSNGDKRGTGIGSSLEFLDHREYFPGDDIRNIDWKTVAKYEKPYVKLFKEEVLPVVELVLDGSTSMSLNDSKKYEALWGLSELLKESAKNSGCSVIRKVIRSNCVNLSSSEIEKCVDYELLCDCKTDAGKNFVAFPPKFKPRSIRILLSDLFWDIEPASFLRVFTKGASMTAVIQVVAEADENPVFLGNIKLVDSETGEFTEMMVDESIIAQYEKNYSLHRDNWQNACRTSGTIFTHLVAETFCKDFTPHNLFETMILLPETIK